MHDSYTKELFLSGLHYAKFIGVLFLIFLDVFTLYTKGFNSLDRSGVVKTSLLFQRILLLTNLFLNFIPISKYLLIAVICELLTAFITRLEIFLLLSSA